MSIKDNLEQIQKTIFEEEQKAGRTADSVKLMAVSKFHTAEEIEQAVNSGASLFGENRVQEAVEKFPPLIEKYPHIELHMIGSLQRNKVKQIVGIASCIQSVDRIELIEEIEKQASKINKKIKIFFELHTGEESKSGFPGFEELKAGVECAAKCPHIIPSGFMTMAPLTEDENAIRQSFITLKNTAQKIKELYPDLPLTELSMGMSGDYKIAISEGSTMVRIGTAIFGKREK